MFLLCIRLHNLINRSITFYERVNMTIREKMRFRLKTDILINKIYDKYNGYER
jgi:hypothetical protein